MDKFLEPDTVRALVDDYRTADLDPSDLAVMELADKVALDATSVTQADIDGLRTLGLTDDDVLDVVLAAAARCFFSKSSTLSVRSPTRSIRRSNLASETH